MFQFMKDLQKLARLIDTDKDLVDEKLILNVVSYSLGLRKSTITKKQLKDKLQLSKVYGYSKSIVQDTITNQGKVYNVDFRKTNLVEEYIPEQGMFYSPRLVPVIISVLDPTTMMYLSELLLELGRCDENK